ARPAPVGHRALGAPRTARTGANSAGTACPWAYPDRFDIPAHCLRGSAYSMLLSRERTRERGSLSPHPLYPLGKGHCTSCSRRGAVAGHVVKDLHIQMLHCPRGGEPVADLRGARLQTLQRQRRDGIDVFVLQGLEGFVIQLLIEHEMAEPARGQDRYPGIALPGFDRIPEGYAKFIGHPQPRLIGWIVGVLHDGYDGDGLPLE